MKCKLFPNVSPHLGAMVRSKYGNNVEQIGVLEPSVGIWVLTWILDEIVEDMLEQGDIAD